jgi:large subunit ribosomal protein L31
MVDTLVLETSIARCGSSSLLLGTIYILLIGKLLFSKYLYFCTVSSGQVKKETMKQGIHPESRKVAFVEQAIGYVLIVNSTIKTTGTYTYEGVEYPSVFIEISSKSHPHYTGEKRILKTGAVDKFYARQKKMEEIQNAKK